ncbi:UNVERIFIED_CONTAM: hypothetical protein NCL1_41939 [Trichonephila clavipes]
MFEIVRPSYICMDMVIECFGRISDVNRKSANVNDSSRVQRCQLTTLESFTGDPLWLIWIWESNVLVAFAKIMR